MVHATKESNEKKLGLGVIVKHVDTGLSRTNHKDIVHHTFMISKKMRSKQDRTTDPHITDM